MIITADKIVYKGRIHHHLGMDIADNGRIRRMEPLRQIGRAEYALKNRILIPGWVNTHSQAFQYPFKGHMSLDAPAGEDTSAWLGKLQQISQSLGPQEWYVVARQAFLEMALRGVTTVGEFHCVHHQPHGQPYSHPHAMVDALIYAARDIGIRLSVIYVVYLQEDFQKPAGSGVQRFCDQNLDKACDRFDATVERVISYRDPRLTWALAAHSVQTVGLEALVGLKVRLSHMPWHIQISATQADVRACQAQYGRDMTPIKLLARWGLLDSCTTLVHAVHVQEEDLQTLAPTGAVVCLCPSTSMAWGQGLAAVGPFLKHHIPVCLGTGGPASSSLACEALQLYKQQEPDTVRALPWAAQVLHMGTEQGARALGVDTGGLNPGQWADWASYDLTHPDLAGADDRVLLSKVYAADPAALQEVVVGGRLVIEGGTHAKFQEVTTAYRRLSSKLWSA